MLQHPRLLINGDAILVPAPESSCYSLVESTALKHHVSVNPHHLAGKLLSRMYIPLEAFLDDDYIHGRTVPHGSVRYELSIHLL